MCNNPNLDLVNINAYAKFGRNPETKFWHVKSHNSIINLQKLTCNNSNLDFADIYTYAVWQKSINSLSRYWVETKFRLQSRNIKGHNHEQID